MHSRGQLTAEFATRTPTRALSFTDGAVVRVVGVYRPTDWPTARTGRWKSTPTRGILSTSVNECFADEASSFKPPSALGPGTHLSCKRHLRKGHKVGQFPIDAWHSLFFPQLHTSITILSCQAHTCTRSLISTSMRLSSCKFIRSSFPSFGSEPQLCLSVARRQS